MILLPTRFSTLLIDPHKSLLPKNHPIFHQIIQFIINTSPMRCFHRIEPPEGAHQSSVTFPLISPEARLSRRRRQVVQPPVSSFSPRVPRVIHFSSPVIIRSKNGGLCAETRKWPLADANFFPSASISDTYTPIQPSEYGSAVFRNLRGCRKRISPSRHVPPCWNFGRHYPTELSGRPAPSTDCVANLSFRILDLCSLWCETREESVLVGFEKGRYSVAWKIISLFRIWNMNFKLVGL